ncbi:hypothetical protein XENORESO_007462, partial [Xenotaenia resolanae]
MMRRYHPDSLTGQRRKGSVRTRTPLRHLLELEGGVFRRRNESGFRWMRSSGGTGAFTYRARRRQRVTAGAITNLVAQGMLHLITVASAGNSCWSL